MCILLVHYISDKVKTFPEGACPQTPPPPPPPPT